MVSHGFSPVNGMNSPPSSAGFSPSPRQISVFHRAGIARTAGTSSRQHETLSHGASDALCGGWAALKQLKQLGKA